jgi:Domain of unknown function (DUF5703)
MREIDVQARLDSFNPIFTGVGTSDRASIPLGNGELCANAWVENDGFHFYLSRSDAITELDRTVKLGEYVFQLEPNPFVNEQTVTQELVLKEGILRVNAGGEHGSVELLFFIDIERNDAVVKIAAENKFNLKVEIRNWRIAKNYSRDAVGMFWGDENPDSLQGLAAICESPDSIIQVGQDLVSFHLNRESIVGGIASLHGLADENLEIPDLIVSRIFGSRLRVKQNPVVSSNSISSQGVMNSETRISTFSSQSLSLDQLLKELNSSLECSDSQKRTADFWRKYWKKSWIYLDGDQPEQSRATEEVISFSSQNGLPQPKQSDVSRITQAYILSKWMNACASNGAMPILYNGSLFTTMPGGGSHPTLDSFGKAFSSEPLTRPTLSLNPDERSWTLEQLWQNIRLPYYSMLARGEYFGLKPLFSYYRRFWELNRARARVHYSARGQWNTEMTLSCGLQSPGIYGADRSGLPAGWTKNRWGGAINLSPGLELSKLMFDYWKATGDDVFLSDEFLPFATDLIDFAVSKYFDENAKKICFDDLNSLETYFDCTNPVAIVAGYRKLALNLLSLSEDLFANHSDVAEFLVLLPAIPIETSAQGNSHVAPAERYTSQRMNVESPEFYTIYPFDLRDQIPEQVLQATWMHSNQVSGAFRAAIIGEKLGSPSFSGWQYHGQVAARLGLVDECLEILAKNSALKNPGFAFPAMWGPIYDSVPDVDHGANILNVLQDLVLEICKSPKLAQKLPRQFVLDFKLYDEKGQPMSGRIEQGKLVRH